MGRFHLLETVRLLYRGMPLCLHVVCEPLVKLENRAIKRIDIPINIHPLSVDDIDFLGVDLPVAVTTRRLRVSHDPTDSATSAELGSLICNLSLALRPNRLHGQR